MHDLGLRDYLHILRRRKRIVIAALIIVPVTAVFLSLRQSSLYESSADVLLRYQTLPSTLSGINDPNSYAYAIDPARSIDTSLQVARLPVLQDKVVAALAKRGVSAAGVGATSAAEVGDTNVLRFTSQTGEPGSAQAIATEYARQFTRYYQELDTTAINRAIAGLQSRASALKDEGTSQARLQAADLQSKVSQLQTLLTLQTAGAVLVREAAGAAKIRPTPRKYGILGLGLALVLGIGLAFLRDAFDTRLRTPDQISGLLKLSLLARVPPPTRRLEREKQLVMLADPRSPVAEAFRRLRMNLEFAGIGKPSQVIMFTSALPREGKSTTLANLGVAMALAGKNVALVDLDLHRPMLAEFFRIGEGQPGLSSVVLGETGLDEALVTIQPELGSFGSASAASNGSSGNGKAPGSDAGSLVVLPTGVLPPDPGEFVGLERIERVVATLRERVDVILLDAPPLLAVGDGLTIAGYTDAIVVVVRSDLARRPITGEFAATLGRLPAVKLGYVLCGAAGLEGSPYYAYSRYGYEFETGKQEAVK